MPTMYPTPLPDAVIKDGRRGAERRVYEALGSHLGPSPSVFYSVAWLSKAPTAAARDGEADFVVVHPERGALLLEVKARRPAAEGFNVLFTGFNRPLADCLRRSAGDVAGLTIANFHQCCWQMGRDAGVPLPEPGAGVPAAGGGSGGHAHGRHVCHRRRAGGAPGDRDAGAGAHGRAAEGRPDLRLGAVVSDTSFMYDASSRRGLTARVRRPSWSLSCESRASRPW
jgi:hypothetical protein